MVFGKLYVQGGIDPTYLALEPNSTDPIPAGLQGIWVENTGDALRIKSNILKLEDLTSTNTVINLQTNGTTQLSVTTNGVQETLLTTQGTATYSSPTLTLVTTVSAPYPTFYSNTIASFTGATNTISTITPPTNMPVNAMYYCYITNSGSGILTINATSLGTGIKTTYTASVSVPAAGFALGTVTKVGATAYIWSVNLVA
jgi:hypothetical protein